MKIGAKRLPIWRRFTRTESCYPAAKSDNAYGGIYAEFPARCKTHSVTVQTKDKYNESVHARISLNHTHRPLRHCLDDRVPLPIFTRGRTFQERFLLVFCTSDPRNSLGNSVKHLHANASQRRRYREGFSETRRPT